MNGVRLGVMLFATIVLVAGAWAEGAGGEGKIAPEGTGSVTLSVESAPEAADKRVGVDIAPQGNTTAASGVATVVGFPVILSGNMGVADWKVAGSTVSGTLVDREGKRAGSFEGTITPSGVSGRYTTADGRTGLWSWDGTMPKATEAAASGEGAVGP